MPLIHMEMIFIYDNERAFVAVSQLTCHMDKQLSHHHVE